MNIKLCKRKKSFEPFWRAALTEHGQSSQSADFWKIAKMALFNRPGNRATLGLLRTYFYYCSIVGLIPVIPYPPKKNW